MRPEDLNANGSLFGGSLLRWIDEEAAIYAIIQLGNHRVVTKLISEIDFQASAREGDLIEMGLIATQFGRTSLTMKARVRNMITRKTILSIEKKWVRPEDLNANGSLFGGSLLRWIDEEAAIYAII
ncbi:hypothetical protein CSW77_26365, partial [Shigella flexneri]